MKRFKSKFYRLGNIGSITVFPIMSKQFNNYDYKISLDFWRFNILITLHSKNET